MSVYEFGLGVYIEADNEEDAMNKISPVLDQLNDLDTDAVIEGPWKVK